MKNVETGGKHWAPLLLFERILTLSYLSVLIVEVARLNLARFISVNPSQIPARASIIVIAHSLGENAVLV